MMERVAKVVVKRTTRNFALRDRLIVLRPIIFCYLLTVPR